MSVTVKMDREEIERVLTEHAQRKYLSGYDRDKEWITEQSMFLGAHSSIPAVIGMQIEFTQVPKVDA